MTKTQTAIRYMGIEDLEFVLRAQAASSNELDAMPDFAVRNAIVSGKFQGLVLETDDRKMLVTWQREGNAAILTTFYREGSPKGFLSDCHEMLSRVEGILREFGVANVFCAVGVNNPKFAELWRLYARLGFASDLIRLSKEL